MEWLIPVILIVALLAVVVKYYRILKAILESDGGLVTV